MTLRHVLPKAVEIYNRYRGSEAVCRIVSGGDDHAILRFEGHFCLTCGVFDWIEDIVYILEDLGVEAYISRVEYHNEEGYVLAEIRLKHR